MATVNDVVANVLLRLREASTGSEFWTDTEFVDYANELVRFAAFDSEMFFKEGTIAGVANKELYAFPSDYIALRWLRYEETLIHHAHPEEWDAKNESWADETGTPLEYSLQIQNGYFRPYPYPAVSGIAASFDAEYGVPVSEDSDDTFDTEYGGITVIDSGETGDSEHGTLVNISDTDNNFQIGYVYLPTDLSIGSTIMYPLSRDISIMEFYILWQCYEKDSEAKDMQKAQYWYQKFAQRYKLLRKHDKLPRSPTIVGSATHHSKHSGRSFPLLPSNYPRYWR